MKKHLFTLLSLFIALASVAQQESCLLNYRDIYSFDVGDIFQYNISSASSNPYPRVKTTKKIEIVSLKRSLDTITYTINEILVTHSTWPSQRGDTTVTDRQYNENKTITYIDSSSSILNNCNDTIAIQEEFYSTKNHYVRIHDTIIENEKMKHVGGDHKNFKKTNGKLNATLCNYLENEYVQGRGQTYHFESACFEYWKEEKMVGYIKNGTTVGKVTSDKVLLSTFGSHDINSSLLTYPNPVDNLLFIKNVTNSTIKIYSNEGNLVQTSNFSNNVIDVDQLKSGIYFYQVFDNHSNKLVKGKFIKK